MRPRRRPPHICRAATFAFGVAYERAVLAWLYALPPEIVASNDRER